MDRQRLGDIRNYLRRGVVDPRRIAVSLAIAGAVSLLAGYQAGQRSDVWPGYAGSRLWNAAARFVLPTRWPRPISNEKTPAVTIADEISRLNPQQQAEWLLEHAMQHDEVSLNLLRERTDGWRGHLQSTDHLFELVIRALDTDDLRVRTAAVEIDLAANHLTKTPESAARLVRQARTDPAQRHMALFRLGALGNRGVASDAAFATLMHYALAQAEDTRYWAVEGLAMLATDASEGALLDILRMDSSPRVRELAACSLGRAGMLTREQRLDAVPHLLNLVDDDSLDSATRGWIYQSLREITGEALGNDAVAWRDWWAHHDRPQEQRRSRDGILRA